MLIRNSLSAVRTTPQFVVKRLYAVEVSSSEEPSTSNRNSSFIPKKIELVPERLHRHLFGSYPVPETAVKNDPFEMLELPNLEGSDLLDHFQNIAMKQFEPYRRFFMQAANIRKLPSIPKKWIFHPGWTRYTVTESPKQVDHPLEDLVFFDVEVCMRDGLLPTLATAVTTNAWYSWCSDRLVNGGDMPELYRLNHLIAFETGEKDLKHRLIIGHNVAFDRSRVKEQYYRKGTNTRFWDTMSMAIPIYGMADHQVALYEKKDTEVDDSGPIGWVDYWRSLVCKNSLSALHEKLCGTTSLKQLNKSLQTFFVKEPIDEIRHSFQDLTTYCAHDVVACFELYQALYPEFSRRFPHPATWQGMLEIGNVYLPVTKNWRKFFTNNETRANNENKIAAVGVVCAARELMENLGKTNQLYMHDPWMWSADWSSRRGEEIPVWYESLLRSRSLVHAPIEKLSQEDVKLKSRVVPRIFGLCWGPYPLHYKTDKGWGFLVPKDSHIALSDVPEMEKVVLRRGVKVTIPVKAILDIIQQNISEGVGDVVLTRPHSSVSIFNFYKLPHPNGENDNVGDPIAKAFHLEIEEGVLWPTRYKKEFSDLYRARNTTRFWNNYRDRFQEQVTVWLDENGEEGAIAPSIIPAGTVTRRAVHKLWLTAINPKDDQMIGTNLKSMVECPQDWHIVGADVDSQEQWIAAMLGDCCVGKGVAGATPFSNMLLAGRKVDHSDLHSVIAREVGISRDKAKVLNYARLYGAGVVHAADFLMQSGMSAKKALSLSSKLFDTTKGKRFNFLKLNENYNDYFRWYIDNLCTSEMKAYYVYANGNYFLPEYRIRQGKLTVNFEDWLYQGVWNKLRENGRDASDFSKDWLIKQIYSGCHEYQLYIGGFESDTFNYLELTLNDSKPRTPVLNCQLGHCLTPLPKDVRDHEYFLKKYRRSIINWVVQSSAVDFLHLLIVCMKWLCNAYHIEARFALSIHDEIRYIVPSEDRYRCALALSLSNMYVRAMISQKLGIVQLPMSVAFFSQVDIDRVLRKEVNLVCKTPGGECIPPGEALDMNAILMKTGGTLKKDNLYPNGRVSQTKEGRFEETSK
uniref:DNA-directed DNA polymerase n=1 Tax=Setaria digitata TaxID=48799 RepID=A0A915PS28_9BILA